MALATVAGFVVPISPGGLGVREWVLWTALASAIDRDLAVVAALVLRLAWVAGEVWSPRRLLPAIRPVADRRASRSAMISVVVPLYNEAESLATLHAELARRRRARTASAPAEFLFVDDGSRDGSWPLIRALAAADARVRGIRFRRNFGKAAALTAGFRAAKGDRLHPRRRPPGRPGRDPPVPRQARRGRLRRRQRLEADPPRPLAQGRPEPGLQPAGQRPDRLPAPRPQLRLQGLSPRGRSTRSTIYGELHRFVPVLAHARGFRVGEIVVHHRARQFGRSKYGVARFIKGLLDLLTVQFLSRYGHRPLHVLGALGLALLAFGRSAWGISRSSG